MAATINLDDLDPEQRKELGIKSPRSHKFSKEDVRRNAIKVLAAIAQQSQAERGRVLDHSPANSRKSA